MTRDTIPDRVQRFGETLKDAAAMHFRVGEAWHTLSWADYATRSRRFAAALIANGYQPGQGLAILSDNCPEWLIAEIGAMRARAVAAGIYQTCTPEQTAYIIQHCEAPVVIVQDPSQWTKVSAQRTHLPCLRKVIVLHGADGIDDPMVCDFDSFLAEGDAHLDAADARFAELEDDDLAVLIYTSGTTGPPKGVMLSHHNLAWTAKQTNAAVGATVSEEDCVVSYLPLSHIAEQLFSIHLPATYGFPVWFAGSVDRLKDTMIAARPTLFLAVPRVWEKFKAALEGKLNEASGLKATIVAWARGVGTQAGPRLIETGELGGFLGVKYAIANRLFFGKLTAQLGLDRLKLAITGAAPIGTDVLEFFMSCGIIIHEVYGQSEDSGPTTFNQPKAGCRQLGTVGLPFPGVDVRIADDGEICVRGPNVFQGYYKNPEATADALQNGWLHSGDIGEFDERGFLRITDRKKDLIITAGGKNVAPQNIEKLLRRIQGIGQAVVIGDRRKFLTALLTIDAEVSPDFVREHDWPTDPTVLAVNPNFVDHVQAGVDAANAELARYETIKRFAILPADFTVEGGELTPTQKVKRAVVRDKYASEIERLYENA